MTDASSTANCKHEDMVLFPIPKRFYPAVLQYLGELHRLETSGQGVSESQPVQVAASDDPSREWTREDVRRLRSMVHNPTILAVFELAKEQDGEFVSIRALEDCTGRKFGQVRADLAGLTRMCRTRLNHGHWPFAAVWAADGREQMSYKVSGDVLRWWYEA